VENGEFEEHITSRDGGDDGSVVKSSIAKTTRAFGTILENQQIQ
jgi:hypothetical protein